jgi:5'-deoxynucleotidase
MASHFYAMLSRMKNIYRWGLMRNTKTENLSEHSFETAYVAHALGVIAKVRLGKTVDPEKIAVAALFHDASEIITGDMPTPVKYDNPEIKAAYKKMEAAAEEKLFSMLPDDLRGEMVNSFASGDAEIQKYVKAADKISALIKCIEELNMGNKEFAVAKESLIKAIKELQMEEADIFLDEFIDSFYLSIDEQH